MALAAGRVFSETDCVNDSIRETSILAHAARGSRRHLLPLFLNPHVAFRPYGGIFYQEVFMDIFWLVPVVILGIALFWGFYMYLKRRPVSSPTPHVLVDKSREETPGEQADKNRDWSKRPCGSFMDWILSRR